jgi:NADH:ubiquinone oxidoreductase subunit E
MLTGGYDVLAQVEKRLGVRAHGTTSDGKITLLEEECLAACADAPMAVCGGRYFLRLDAPEKVDAMLDELVRG